jgi:hypothetical protein
MARYEHLNVYKEIYNLSVSLFSDISKFDRSFKFTLWDKITNTLIKTLELIIFINNIDSSSRKPSFEKLESFLEKLVIFINITNDLKLFWNSKKYLNYLEILVKVKKMVKCWNNELPPKKYSEIKNHSTLNCTHKSVVNKKIV